MQGRPHVVRLLIGAGYFFVRSLHLLKIVVVPGYGGYSSDDTAHLREISVVLIRGTVRLLVEIDHANSIVVTAR
jgi:hypothetical protein